MTAAEKGPEERFMRLSIKEAMKGIKAGDGGPFGACIVKGGEVVSKAHNTVLERKDSTCHAEINAIRKACKKLGTIDLSGCIIYSTTEPCPMCFSAIHWARIDSIVYGTEIRDVAKLGFNEMQISNSEIKRTCKSRISLVPGFLRGECLGLLGAWKNGTGNRTY